MIYISHRGNVNNVNRERENSPEYIQEAIDIGFDVEVDLRIKNGRPHLGHDTADYCISFNWLLERKDRLWIHVKEYLALQWLLSQPIKLNFFCHQSDDYTLVSNGKIWCHDWTNELNDHCIIPLISKEAVLSYDIRGKYPYAVCSDFLLDCKMKFNDKII